VHDALDQMAKQTAPDVTSGILSTISQLTLIMPNFRTQRWDGTGQTATAAAMLLLQPRSTISMTF